MINKILEILRDYNGKNIYSILKETETEIFFKITGDYYNSINNKSLFVFDKNQNILISKSRAGAIVRKLSKMNNDLLIYRRKIKLKTINNE